MLFYAYLPLIAVVALAIRFVVLPNGSSRAKYIIVSAALASIVAFMYLPFLRSFVVLLQVAFSIYLILYLMVASDGK